MIAPRNTREARDRLDAVLGQGQLFMQLMSKPPSDGDELVLNQIKARDGDELVLNQIKARDAAQVPQVGLEFKTTWSREDRSPSSFNPLPSGPSFYYRNGYESECTKVLVNIVGRFYETSFAVYGVRELEPLALTALCDELMASLPMHARVIHARFGERSKSFTRTWERFDRVVTPWDVEEGTSIVRRRQEPAFLEEKRSNEWIRLTTPWTALKQHGIYAPCSFSELAFDYLVMSGRLGLHLSNMLESSEDPWEARRLEGGAAVLQERANETHAMLESTMKRVFA